MDHTLPAWPFVGYEKIVESPSKWQLTEASYRRLNKVPWCVTEKIHGANFCLVTDGAHLRCAKRKAFLQADEDFFDHTGLLPKLGDRLRQLFTLLRTRHPKLERIAVYGELFGGGYPHPDVKPIDHLQPIQTGIYYTPDIEFCAFDIALESPSREYLDYDQALELFHTVELFCAEPLFTGKYDDARNVPITFESTIPARLGLPPMADNPAEGVVIKPLKTIYVETHKGRVRPILKKKIPRFAEDAGFHQARKWTAAKPHTDHLQQLRYAVQGLVGENRLHNAISKIGRLSTADSDQSRQVFAAFIDDVNEQLKEDHARSLAALSPLQHEQLQAFIKAETRALFKIYFAR